jgi:hypothetical protein
MGSGTPKRGSGGSGPLVVADRKTREPNNRRGNESHHKTLKPRRVLTSNVSYMYMMSMQGPNKIRNARKSRCSSSLEFRTSDQGEQRLRGGAIATILTDRLTLVYTRVGRRRRMSVSFPTSQTQLTLQLGHCLCDLVGVKDDGYYCILRRKPLTTTMQVYCTSPSAFKVSSSCHYPVSVQEQSVGPGPRGSLESNKHIKVTVKLIAMSHSRFIRHYSTTLSLFISPTE